MAFTILDKNSHITVTDTQGNKTTFPKTSVRMKLRNNRITLQDVAEDLSDTITFDYNKVTAPDEVSNNALYETIEGYLNSQVNFVEKSLENLSDDPTSGVSRISIVGENKDIDMGSTPETLWELSRLWVPSVGNVIDTMSSTSTLDTSIIVIQGVTSDYVEVVQLATLNGQNKVVLDTPLFRVNGVTVSPTSVDLIGLVYVYEDTPIVLGVPTDLDKVQGFIDVGCNLSKQLIYTVPLGMRLKLFDFFSFFSRSGAGDATLLSYFRSEDGVSYCSVDLTVKGGGDSILEGNFTAPIIVTEKTDLWIEVSGVTNNNTAVTTQIAGYREPMPV